MFHSISLNRKNEVFSKYNIENEGGSTLYKLGKINIFIGTNNSGKSRLLREIFKILSVAFNTEKPLENEIDVDLMSSESIISILKEHFDSAKKHITDASRQSVVDKHIDPYFSELQKFSHYNFAEIQNFANTYSGELEKIENKIFSLEGIGNDPNHKRSRAIKSQRALFHQPAIIASAKISGDTQEKLKAIKYHTTYIPILRGLRKLSGNADLFHHKTKLDYFGGVGAFDIFTGNELYNKIKNLLLSNYKERQQVIKFEDFLTKIFFNGERISLIPREFKDPKYAKDNNIQEVNDDIYIKIGDEKEFPIYLLGDGIQSIIILLFPLFIHQHESHLLFIEEPELSLHPGMQRAFIEALNNFPKAQIFIATHSNHFLDMTLEVGNKISVYSFNKKLPKHDDQEKEADILVQIVTSPDSGVLELIGVKNSSVFLSNCTIWVEGITDRFYIRKYLELYQHDHANKFKEDIHFSFVEYGGGNITHWSFLDNRDENPMHKNINVDRICGKLFLITDKDGEDKNERHKKLQEKLKDRYVCLEAKEIENLLTPDIIKKTVEVFEKNAGNTDVKYKTEFTIDDYKAERLGNFLNAQITNKKIKTYASKTGSIHDKSEFAKRAIDKMKNKSNLSEEAQKLTKNIYNFIELNNK